MAFSLETERLTLRLRTPDDADWSLELLGERDDGTTLQLADVATRLAEQVETSHKNGFGLLTMRRREDGEPIGYCGLIVGRTTFDEPEIAYELLRAHHGQGYATEAARAVVDEAFRTGRTRLWATIGDWNTASLRVVEKLGFRRDRTVVIDGRPVVYTVLDA